MSTLKDRIQELMRASGMDERAMAKAAGVTPSAVYQWLGHGSKPINSIGDIEAATKLMWATGFSALWISKGKGPKYAHEQSAPTISSALHVSEASRIYETHATKAKMAPVIEWVSLGVNLSKSNNELSNFRQLSMPAEASETCKWVCLDSDILKFRLRKGDKIAVDIEFSIDRIEDGALCIFRNARGSYLLGEYRSLAQGQYEAIVADGSALDTIRHGVQVAAIVRGTWR